MLRWSVLCGLLFASSVALSQWHEATGSAMGTVITVNLWHEDEARAQAAIKAVFTEMERIDALWNPADVESELYYVNNVAVTEALTVSAELCRVIDKALYYSALSQGAFDISFATVGQYYDYRAGKQPADEQRERLLKSIDYRQIQLDRETCALRFKNHNIQIDLGGIAKGYAVDRAIELLRTQYAIAHATVSAGGDSRMLGDRRGRPWMIGVKNPRDEDGVAVVLPLQDVAVSTSGDYERYYIDPQSGERVHHIINPGSGRSATGVTSVTIIGPRGFDTDPLSTTVFVLGPEKGMALVEQLPEFDAILIDSSGHLHYSSGLQAPE